MKITNKQNKSNVLSIICYVVSGVLLLSTLVLAVMIAPFSHSVMDLQIFFQLTGLETLANALLRPLQALIINAGILIAILTLLLAFIIFLAGRILARQSKLQEQFRLLEEKMK